MCEPLRFVSTKRRKIEEIVRNYPLCSLRAIDRKNLGIFVKIFDKSFVNDPTYRSRFWKEYGHLSRWDGYPIMDTLIRTRCDRKPIIVARTMFPGSEVTAREREERKEDTNGADIKDAAMPLVKLPLTVLSIREHGSKEHSISGVPFAAMAKNQKAGSTLPTFPLADPPRNVITNDIARPALSTNFSCFNEISVFRVPSSERKSGRSHWLNREIPLISKTFNLIDSLIFNST